jgi:homoserine dehydrogenase
MIGAGTVGGGVYEIIMNRLGGGKGTPPNDGASSSSSSSSSSSKAPTPIITKICVRDASRPRNFHVDPAITKIVTDVSSMVNDPDIDMVVEVAGGVTFAKDAVYASIRNGKSVVTANKALIAENMEELISMLGDANENEANARRGGVRFGYEASVCGGIPVIHALQSCYAGDIINEVMGICNGTTNFMLGKMEEGADYDAVLREAQELGFAEADPSADVEGYDVRAKIAILAKLAFGVSVPIDTIPCMGITNVSVVDFAYAKSMGCTIKLVGTAVRKSRFGEHDGALSVYVSPKLVPDDHLLASATGCGNALVVRSANLGLASYGGPGAGRYPTANSVVADIMRVANGTCPIAPFPPSASSSSSSSDDDDEIDNDYESAFYVRVSFRDGLGIVRIIGELAESQGVSIHSILQRPITDRMAADTVVTTESCKLSQVEALCELIGREEFALCTPVFMPMIPEY